MLACVLGRNGEIFFPKLGEEQMLTFSSICDKYVESMGCQKKVFSSDEEAKHFAADMPFDLSFILARIRPVKRHTRNSMSRARD